MLHGLGENRNDDTNALGMSINTIAETQLAPQGYAVAHLRRARPRPVGGARRRSTARARSRTCASSSTGSRRSPGINPQRIGAFGYSYGGGAIWRATAEGVPFAAIEPAITWTDLYSALAPQNLARSGVVLGFWQSIAARAAPEVEPIVNDALAGRNLAGVRAFADQRSTRPLLGNDQGADLPHAGPARLRVRRRPGARGVLAPEGAEAALPRRLRARAVAEPGRRARARPARRRGSWFDRYLKGLPNGIDTQPPVEVAPDPWTGRTFSYRSLPARKTLRLAFSGRSEIGSTGKVARTLPRRKARLETFGPPVLRVALSSPNGWPHVVAVLSAVTPQRPGDRRQLRRRARPARLEAEAGRDPADQPGDERPAAVAASPDHRRQHRPLRAPGTSSICPACPRSARLVVGPARLTLPVSRRSRSRADAIDSRVNRTVNSW